MAAFRRFFLRRLFSFNRAAAPAGTHARDAAAAELWCRPATVIALRDPARAPACVAGWR